MKPEIVSATIDGFVTTDIQERGYFSNWNDDSVVRTRPYRYTCKSTDKDDPASGDWFFPSALTFLSNPLLAGLPQGQVQEILARNLITFLEYTTLLEHRIVNKSVQFIAQNCLPVSIPHGMRMDALRVYTDEGYHAIMSADVANQVSRIYGIAQENRQFSRIARLEAMAETFQLPTLGWFLIGFVSETAITTEFTKMGRTSLVPGVHNMLMDHLSDEWKHSRYFTGMFSYLWPRLTESERDFCATQLPSIIHECFRLDGSLLERDFCEMGIDSNIARIISEERGKESEHRLRARTGAVATLHALKSCSFFNDPRYVATFTRYGLID
ncbi:diiron oxygenase [Cupriavidus sp. AcVe19-1a]|uniref:diiron oxygenase n=1 Tax=Cupriavidus sp. AcVe19-1a TaxID=2821359 RepID=UPI001AE338EC|nr:diiron oxygenase [Cupriavidus sp. AcVe19-1a]MBP0633423.1 diiron oxygenase [Cupriavidus sp. AcVe19-1a]